MGGPTILSELIALRDDLADRYDGAPDSSTLWMCSGLAALDQLIDGTGNREYAAREKLHEIVFNPQT